jgi:hypothetical protein
MRARIDVPDANEVHRFKYAVVGPSLFHPKLIVEWAVWSTLREAEAYITALQAQGLPGLWRIRRRVV